MNRISTISLHQLPKEGQKEQLFLFAVLVKPSSVIKEESTIQ